MEQLFIKKRRGNQVE